jgi:Zn-dependent protease with chaperone function
MSVRVPAERRALVWCTLLAPITILIVSIVLPSLTISEFVLVIASGLVFVAIARGRLIGSSIRVEPRQFPELAFLVDELAARLGIPTPQVFIRDDQANPIGATGVGEPYAIVISSQYYELLQPGELAFLIAREIAHIAAGHTRWASLLSASGRENPIVSLVFGAWLRRCELTADRVGVLCCDDLEDAFGAICMTTFHSAGRRVDRFVLAEQRAELAADPSLRLGELIASVPYATTRLDALRAFVASPLAAHWRPLLQRRDVRATSVPATAERDLQRDDFASTGRRVGAAAVDFGFISAIVRVPLEISGKLDAHSTNFERYVLDHLDLVHFGANAFGALFAYFAYSAILVALIGQTLGMTVFNVRVVTTGFVRPSIAQSIWRYLVAFGSLITFVAPFVVLFGFFRRVQPHDLLSRTRVVRARDV